MDGANLLVGLRFSLETSITSLRLAYSLRGTPLQNRGFQHSQKLNFPAMLNSKEDLFFTDCHIA